MCVLEKVGFLIYSKQEKKERGCLACFAVAVADETV